MGHYIALLGIFEWSLAGLLYPISIHWIVGQLGIAAYLNFGASHVLCGLIAAVYPFFLITFLSVRVLYPALIGQGSPADGDVVALRQASRRMNGYLFLAGSIPAISVAMLVLAGLVTASQATFALLVLSIVGAAGFGLTFALYRTLQRDLAALVLAASPVESLSALSESITEM